VNAVFDYITVIYIKTIGDFLPLISITKIRFFFEITKDYRIFYSMNALPAHIIIGTKKGSSTCL